MTISIFNIKEHPEWEKASIDWFSSKWGIDRSEYERSFAEMFAGTGALPQWFLALNEKGRIVGGCGLIQNDFCDRIDLFPYLCALFVEPFARGQGLGGRLLAHGRMQAHESGFERLYLCTDHTAYYERYGWGCIGTARHPGGEISRLYCSPVWPLKAME